MSAVATRGRRVLALLLAMVVVLAPALGLAPAAQAHGGYQILSKTSGAYAVVVRVRPFEFAGRSKIDVTSYVVRQDIGEPDLNAALVVTLDGPDGRRVLRPELIGDGYQSIVDADRDAWRRWAVTARVTGRAGTATVVGEPFGADPGAPDWLLPASLGLIVVLGAGIFFARDHRARRAADGDDETSDDWGAAPGA